MFFIVNIFIGFMYVNVKKIFDIGWSLCKKYMWVKSCCCNKN